MKPTPQRASSLQIRPVDPQGADALFLLREAAIEARGLYRDLQNPAAPWPTNPPLPERGAYVVAYAEGTPVGCGALRPLDDSTVEIRRIYVVEMERRKGIARAILVALERLAREMAFQRMRLETGNRQEAALALYEASGFRRIPPFGEYVHDPTSMCYEKMVASAPA